MQAREIEDELTDLLHSFDVEIIKGRDYVQVRSKNVNKGVFVTQVLEAVKRKSNIEIELVVCIGDDTTDESMYIIHKSDYCVGLKLLLLMQIIHQQN